MTRIVLVRKLVENIPFKEVQSGQRFWHDDEEHIRLFEDTDEWNCCELSSGCLGYIQPDIEVEVIVP